LVKGFWSESEGRFGKQDFRYTAEEDILHLSGCHVGLRGQRCSTSTSRARLQLGNFLRTLAMPEPIKNWSMTSLKE